MKDKVTDMELLRWTIDTLGAIRMGRLLLFCLYWRATGCRKFAEVAEREEGIGATRATRYRAYRDLVRVADWVAEREGRAVERDEVARRLLEVGAGAAVS